jgi:biopolymer transport protein TolR
MTPLIDVMLVLLVIFIVTAPLMVSRLRLDLPRSDAARPGDAPESIAVAVTAQGQLFVGDEAVDEATLTRRLADLARANAAAEVQLRAERSVPYGRVAELIGLVQGAGLTRIGFVAEPKHP